MEIQNCIAVEQFTEEIKGKKWNFGFDEKVITFDEIVITIYLIIKFVKLKNFML